MTTQTAERKLVAHNHFTFNKQDTGGEAVGITTYFWNNGQVTQTLTMQSYCNCAAIALTEALVTPDSLRQAANILEKRWIQVKTRAKLEKPKAETKLDTLQVNLSSVPDAEPLVLQIEYVDNGDSAAGLETGIYTNQELRLDFASFTLGAASLDENILRRLANQLDSFITLNDITV